MTRRLPFSGVVATVDHTVRTGDRADATATPPAVRQNAVAVMTATANRGRARNINRVFISSSPSFGRSQRSSSSRRYGVTWMTRTMPSVVCSR